MIITTALSTCDTCGEDVTDQYLCDTCYARTPEADGARIEMILWERQAELAEAYDEHAEARFVDLAEIEID
jgi:hypothetical protein